VRWKEAAGEEVCKITMYIVDYKREEHVPIHRRGPDSVVRRSKPANVVVGIATMSPGYLIEDFAFVDTGLQSE
jgi:hypothetical protein